MFVAEQITQHCGILWLYNIRN